MSKAAVAMAAKLFAVRLAEVGIPVFDVRPGIIATDMTANVREAYDKRIAEGLIPEGRWGTAEDVGRAVGDACQRRHAVHDRQRHPRRRRAHAAAPVGGPYQ